MLVLELVLVSGREQLVPKILTNQQETSRLILVFPSKGIKLRCSLYGQDPVYPFFFHWGEMTLLTLMLNYLLMFPSSRIPLHT